MLNINYLISLDDKGTMPSAQILTS